MITFGGETLSLLPGQTVLAGLEAAGVAVRGAVGAMLVMALSRRSR